MVHLRQPILVSQDFRRPGDLALLRGGRQAQVAVVHGDFMVINQQKWWFYNI